MPTVARPVVPGFGQIIFSFTAWTQVGIAPISDYTVTCTSSNGGVPITATVTPGSNTIGGAPGTTGKLYTCTLTGRSYFVVTDTYASTTQGPTASVLTY